ncbi:MAG: hypothetical protein AB7S38_38835 [Vulcanimicrobiota bacterium]
MNDLEKMADAVASREDLAKFLEVLSRDCATFPDDWAHWKVENYLDAVSAWLKMPFFENTKEVDPSTEPWRLAARIFLVGKIYE